MRKYLLPGLVLIMIVIVGIFSIRGSGDTDCGAVLKTLETDNQVLSNQNSMLERKINTLKLQADSLMRNVHVQQQAVIKLNKKRNEKIQAINNYDVDELVSFFTSLKTDSSSFSH